MAVENKAFDLEEETNNNRNHFGSCSSLSSEFPVTIDLTGPSPVVSVYNSASKRFSKLLKEAPGLPSTLENVPNSSEIEEELVETGDIDPQLWEEGKSFVSRNFFALLFAHLVSIAFLLAVKPLQALLLRTGGIHQEELSGKRYFRLVLAMQNIYTADLLSKDAKDSVALAELKVLQNTGRKLGKKYKLYVPPPPGWHEDEDEEATLQALHTDLFLIKTEGEQEREEQILRTNNPTIPLSQYDLACVQFAFFGFVSLFPKVFGIHEKVPKGFAHLWAIYGRRLGLCEEFNLALNYNEELNRKIFENIFLFSLKLGDGGLLKLWRRMATAFFFFKTKPLVHFILKDVGKVEEVGAIWGVMSWGEKALYYVQIFWFRWILRWRGGRAICNYGLRLGLYIGRKVYSRRLKKEEKYEYDKNMMVKAVSYQ